MGFNFYFDIAAIAILLFIVFSVILKKQLNGTSNKLYLIVVATAFVSAVLDIVASLDFLPLTLLFGINTIFFISRAATAISLFFYACNLGKIYEKMKKKKWSIIVSFIPFFILIVFLIINIFTRIIFDYLEGPEYQRGDLVWIAYALNYIYASVSLVIIVYSRKYHSLVQVIAVFLAFVFQIGASVFQFLVSSVLVEMFITALTLLTLSIFIENPDISLDFKTRNLNYRSFVSDLKYKLDEKNSFSVIFIKVTNSSVIYNLYPHEKVMEFNQLCSASVSKKGREIDSTTLVYYLGNETFAYVFNDSSKGEEMLNMINGEFSKPFSKKGITFEFIAKTCLVNCPTDCKDVTGLVAFSTMFFDLNKDATTIDLKPYRYKEGNLLFELDHVLERAIKEESFSVYYQGIFDLNKNRITAAEALVRLNDPTFGLIMPSLMIPYSESRGKMIPIGKIIIDKAFKFFKEELRGKLDYIEINLSPLQLLDRNLINDISSLASKHDIKPREIVFEITENTAATEDPTVENNIKTLRKLGYRIAIDDFGTGYSNLSRLMMLDISVLKFDKSMTDLYSKGIENPLFLSISHIFHNKGIKILYEGVETKDVADKLRLLKVDHIQGYYYSKTLPEKEFLTLINNPIEYK